MDVFPVFFRKKDATFIKSCYFRPHSTNFPHLYSIQGTPYSRMFFDYRRLAIVLVSIHLLTYYLRNAFLQCSVVLILSVLNLCHLQEGLLIILRTSTQPCVPCCSFGHLPITAYYHVNTQRAFLIFLAAVSHCLCSGSQVRVFCSPLFTFCYCPRLIFYISVWHMTASQDL